MFSLKHLEAIVFSIVVIFILLKVLLNKKYKIENVMIGFIIMFYFFEVVKVGYQFAVYHKYQVKSMPFYLCSTPLYFLWIFAFTKNQKVLHIFKSISCAIFLTAGLAALLYPSIIIGNTPNWSFTSDNILPAVSILFHTLMIAVPLFMLISGYYKPQYKDIKYILIALLIMMFTVFWINKALDADFFFLNKGKGSPVEFLKEVNVILFTFVTAFLHLFIIGGVHLLMTKIFNSIRKKRNGKLEY